MWPCYRPLLWSQARIMRSRWRWMLTFVKTVICDITKIFMPDTVKNTSRQLKPIQAQNGLVHYNKHILLVAQAF